MIRWFLARTFCFVIGHVTVEDVTADGIVARAACCVCGKDYTATARKEHAARIARA